ncbi:MAG: hypothetical protein Kow00109_14500 [Acidobacteriota bacterium]
MGRTLKILQLVFLSVGIVLLATGIWFYMRTTAFTAEALSSTGRVVDFQVRWYQGRRYYHPVITFADADGETHTFVDPSGANPPSYGEGQQVPILYRPDSPEDARVASFWSLWGTAAITGGIGLLFTIVGLGFSVASWRTRARKHLVQTGIPLEASFVGVEENRRITVNGRHPFQILMRGRDPLSGDELTFRSDFLWEDPTGQLDPAAVRVFIDPHNPRRYYVDLSQALRSQP